MQAREGRSDTLVEIISVNAVERSEQEDTHSDTHSDTHTHIQRHKRTLLSCSKLRDERIILLI